MAGGFPRALVLKATSCTERVAGRWVLDPRGFSVRHHHGFKAGFSCSGICENALKRSALLLVELTRAAGK